MNRVNESWSYEYFEDEAPPPPPPVLKVVTPKATRGGPVSDVKAEFFPVSPSAKYIWHGATISLGRKTYCKGWVTYHPGNFFVVRRSWWNRMEDHQKAMNDFFGAPVPGSEKKGALNPKAEDDPRYKPDPKELTCGQVIAVFHREEWHRGLILQIFKEKAVYKVMLVDFGDHKNHPLENIRLLPEKFLKFPAQAIKCCLYFDGPGKALNGSKVEWTGLEAAKFRELMEPCLFYMEFVEYEVDWDLANPVIWKCRVQRIISSHDLNRMYEVEKMYLSDMLLKKLQKCFEEQKKKEIKVPESGSQSLWYSFMKQFSLTHSEDLNGLNESMSNFDGVFCSAEKLEEKE